MAKSQSSFSQEWQAVLASGDREAFQQVVQPHMDALLRAARSDLRYYVAQGQLHRDDLSPEEVTGEALIRAWQHREQRPEQMGLRAWLLSNQYRVLRALVDQHTQYRQQKAISLEEPLPPRAGTLDTQEWFWEWYQPDAHLVWEDVIPASEPVDLEVPLYEAGDLLPGDANLRHVLMMHDEFEMSLPEVAFAMNQAVKETAEQLDQARMNLRERLGTPSESERERRTH